MAEMTSQIFLCLIEDIGLKTSNMKSFVDQFFFSPDYPQLTRTIEIINEPHTLGTENSRWDLFVYRNHDVPLVLPLHLHLRGCDLVSEDQQRFQVLLLFYFLNSAPQYLDL